MGAGSTLPYTAPPMHVARLILVLALSFPSAAWSQTATPSTEAPGPEDVGPAPKPQPPSKPLDLDRLLRPPGGAIAPPVEQTYGGRDRGAWQDEFVRARAEVADLEGKVENLQSRLREATGGDWNYAPAGGEISDPEVLKLRAQLRRDRQSLEASRQRLRDLQVEASLAGVPEEWRGP